MYDTILSSHLSVLEFGISVGVNGRQIYAYMSGEIDNPGVSTMMWICQGLTKINNLPWEENLRKIMENDYECSRKNSVATTQSYRTSLNGGFTYPVG